MSGGRQDIWSDTAEASLAKAVAEAVNGAYPYRVIVHHGPGDRVTIVVVPLVAPCQCGGDRG